MAAETATVQLELVGTPFVIADEAPYCSFTDIAALKDGRLAVVYYAGKSHVDDSAEIHTRLSSDHGKTWSKPSALRVPENGSHPRDPHLTVLRNGTLLLSYFIYKGKTPDACRSQVVASTDGGKTWSNPAQVDVEGSLWNATSGKIFEADEKTLHMPLYLCRKGETNEESGVISSSDGGRTWKNYVTIAKCPAAGMDAPFNEAEFARLKDRSIVALIRAEGQPGGALAISKDNGKTWQAPEKSPVGHAPGLLVDGDWLLVNYRNLKVGTTGLAISLDGGRSFAHSLTLSGSVTSWGDCAYGGIVKLPVGAPAAYLTTFYTQHKGKVATMGCYFNVR
ncbi:MAG TPA: sialidase family protein [Planctomycetota bacterium]|nr:sialidase family protein [Planctomycetota bacterium]